MKLCAEIFEKCKQIILNIPRNRKQKSVERSQPMSKLWEPSEIRNNPTFIK